VLTTAKLDATGHRWLAALAAFDFTLTYKAGKLNADADALSRIPASAGYQPVTLKRSSIKEICSVATEPEPEPVAMMANLNAVLPPGDSTNPQHQQLGQSAIPVKDVARLQQEDPVISAVLH
jgi:hypothetical protein